MSAEWRVEFSSKAERDLRRLDRKLRERVLTAVERCARDPSQVELKRLKAPRNVWRLRVGEWRVLMTLEPDVRRIDVHRVLPRGRAYRR